MKRNLVVTSSTIVRAELRGLLSFEETIADAKAAERKRLEAYLYGHSTLVAVTYEVESYGQGEQRVTQRALVTVEGQDAPAARYLADYQAGRLQSGSFGVIDYVEDEQAAREHVGIVDEPEVPISLHAALIEAANLLGLEEVEYALGLDSDHLEHSYVTENGVQRPRTEDDLNKEIAHHNKIVQALLTAADILKES